MAVFADKCPDISITVVDTNVSRIEAWNSGDLSLLPVFEPGLSSVIERTRGKNLFFSHEINKNIIDSDLIFISVNTPTKSTGLGAGQASDLKWVEICARQISEVSVGHTIVVEKSTLPVRTAKVIKEILVSKSNNYENNRKTFSILSNPEFLSEGTAIKDLESPDRVLIGGEDESAINSLKRIYQNWVPKEKIITTSLWSSELSKLVANAFLAQRISSINSISALCEATGANINEVSNAVGLDKRIGSEFLSSGPGFGGSCFKKDILNLVYLCEYFGLKEVADFWSQVVLINSWQQERIYKIIVDKLFRNLSGKVLSIFGFAFKANTNDTRESPAIELCKLLLIEGAILNIHDPQVTEEKINEEIISCLNKSKENIENYKGKWFFKKNILDSAKNSDAIIITTDWDCYKVLDWNSIAEKMRNPAWVFDTRNVVNSQTIYSSGLNYWGVGEGYEEI